MDKSMPGTFFVEIVAPSGTIFSSEATRFRAPGIRGSFEVLYNHAPLMAATGVGPVYVTTASGERITLVTSGGFVQVLDNRVIMIAETAERTSSGQSFQDVELHGGHPALQVLHARERAVMLSLGHDEIGQVAPDAAHR